MTALKRSICIRTRAAPTARWSRTAGRSGRRRRHRVLALTDHDTIAGLREAQASADACGVRLVPGVEILAAWRSPGHSCARSYGFDPGSAPLLPSSLAEQGGQAPPALAQNLRPHLTTIGLPGDAAASLRRGRTAACRPARIWPPPLVARGACAELPTRRSLRAISAAAAPPISPPTGPRSKVVVGWIHGRRRRTASTGAPDALRPLRRRQASASWPILRPPAAAPGRSRDRRQRSASRRALTPSWRAQFGLGRLDWIGFPRSRTFLEYLGAVGLSYLMA